MRGPVGEGKEAGNPGTSPVAWAVLEMGLGAEEVLGPGPCLLGPSCSPYIERVAGRGATATSSLPLGAARPGTGSKGRGWPAPSRNPKPVPQGQGGRHPGP